jgi:hypothetical protein
MAPPPDAGSANVSRPSLAITSGQESPQRYARGELTQGVWGKELAQVRRQLFKTPGSRPKEIAKLNL